MFVLIGKKNSEINTRKNEFKSLWYLNNNAARLIDSFEIQIMYDLQCVCMVWYGTVHDVFNRRLFGLGMGS